MSQHSLSSIPTADLVSDQQLEISKLLDNVASTVQQQDDSGEEKQLTIDEDVVATEENGGLEIVEIPADEHHVSSQAARQMATPIDDEVAAPVSQMGHDMTNGELENTSLDASGSFSDPPAELNTPVDHERQLIDVLRNAKESLHANFDVTIGNEIDISSMVEQLHGDETVKRAIVNSYASHMEEMKQLRLAFRQYAAAFEKTKKLPNYMDIVSRRTL